MPLEIAPSIKSGDVESLMGQHTIFPTWAVMFVRGFMGSATHPVPELLPAPEGQIRKRHGSRDILCIKINEIFRGPELKRVVLVLDKDSSPGLNRARTRDS